MFAVTEVIRLMAPLRYLVDQTALGLKHPAPRLVIITALLHSISSSIDSFSISSSSDSFSSLKLKHGPWELRRGVLGTYY